MFVEKLTKEDLIDFIKCKNFTSDEDEKVVFDFDNMTDLVVKSGKVSFSLPYKKYTKPYRYILNHCSRIPDFKTREVEGFLIIEAFDFGFSIDETFSIRNDVLNKSWLRFMYSKFGEKYKKEFLKFREAKKAEVLKATASEFDNETKKWTNSLEDCQEK